MFDYYLALRMKSLNKCLPHLYRLFCASVLLRASDCPQARRSHNYPKMMLCCMLITEHWRRTHYVGRAMMKKNMHMYNEELGEISFSVLARCVLGDNHKSDLQHLRSLYKLLPVYRDTKDQLLADTTSSDSINYRYTIKPGDDSVMVVTLFFQRTIRQIRSGEYRSYNGSSEAYKSAAKAVGCLTVDCLPEIFRSDITDLVDAYFDQIDRSVHSNFLYSDRDIWREADDSQNEDDANDGDRSNLPVGEGLFSDMDDSDNEVDVQWGADPALCIVGHFAVYKKLWDDGDGVAVGKIIRINEPRQYPDSHDHWNNFDVKTRVCTTMQKDIECLKASWHFNHRFATNENVINYEVLAYCSKLETNNKLPVSVVQMVTQLHRHAPLFRDNSLGMPEG